MSSNYTMKVLRGEQATTAKREMVMLKVLRVDEGLLELVAEPKYKVRAEHTGKVTNCNGQLSTPIKYVPTIHDVKAPLKSPDHMLLAYEPFMKRIHPRASTEHFECFMIEGSSLMFIPSHTDFEPDFDNVVEVSNPDLRHNLFFRRMNHDQVGEASHDPTTLTQDLWWGTNVQSAKIEPLLRCEMVGSGISEEIPLSELVFAVPVHDSSCFAGPYAPTVASTFQPSPLNYQSGPGMKKLQKKQMGKADAQMDSDTFHAASRT